MLSNCLSRQSRPAIRRSVIAVAAAVCLTGSFAATPAIAQPIRGSISQKGSLLIFPIVEIKWDDDGKVLQDTIIDLSNDYAGHVFVQLYFINGDRPLEEQFGGFPVMRMNEAEPGWNWADCRLMLTANQPIFWSSLTAEPRGCQPFGVLDPPALYGKWGRPDPETNGATRVLRGYVLAWAVRENPATGQWDEIRWNHLKGDAVVVNYAEGTAFEYNAHAFQIHRGANGGFTGTPGTLFLDGTEYENAPDELVLDFYASGSSALSHLVPLQSGSVAVSIDTDLTLLPVSADLRQDNDGPVATKVEAEIWNEFESKFSGTRRCISCWDQTLLSGFVTSVAIPNHFLRSNLRTDKGKARLDGVASDECDYVNEPFNTLSQDTALLGIATKVMHFEDGTVRDSAAMNLVGIGEQAATIRYDAEFRGDELRGSGRAAGTRNPGAKSIAPIRSLESIPVDETAAE